MSSDLISEKVIEDILSSDISILAEILSVKPDALSQVARQKTLKSGKLDLLYLHEDVLFLIELKVTGFHPDMIMQINQYFEDIRELQAQHKLINSEVRKIILVTDCKPEEIERCRNNSIELLLYKPEFVLLRYYENFKELSHFLTLRSGDYGVVRLGLLKSTLQLLSLGTELGGICRIEGRSEKTVRNRLSVATFLGLVAKHKNEYFLTDFGNTLLEKGDDEVDDRFNAEQTACLSDFVTENPFYSSITYTIFSLLEAVFVLAKNQYPVPQKALQDYFVKSVGKEQTWKRSRARETATYIFSNYACELQFLAKVGNCFYVTHKGIQAILLLQLNRSIKIIESQK
jgi:hypothetical protein